MKKLLLAALVVLSACVTTPAPAPLPKDAAQIAPDTLEKMVAPPPPTKPVPYVALPAVEPMKLVVLPAPNKPSVSLRLVFRTGSVDDPKGREGLTALTLRVLLEGGTKSLDASQFLEALFPMAAELSGDTDREFSTIAARVPKERWARFLEIFQETLLAPRLDSKEFERLKSEQLNALRTRLRQENDEELSKAALDALLAESHPYGHPAVGTEEGLGAITLDDVRAHWKNVFTQDRLIIGLAGGVDDALAAGVKTTLGQLPATGTTRAPLPTLPGPIGNTIILKRDTASTAGNFGFSSPIRRDHPDFVDLFIAFSYFGEHRQEHGVLFQEVRDRRGLNYGTYAYAQHYRQDPGESVPRPNVLRSQQDVTFWLRPVPSKDAVFATRAIVYFLEKTRSTPPPADRFETARGFLAGATRIWTLTDQRRLGWAIDDVIHGTPDFLGQVRTRLQTITPADVQAVMKKHVALDSLNFAFVTKDAEGLAAALKSGAPSPITYQSPKPKDLLADDEQIAKQPLPLSADRVRVEDAADFMRR
ncbi:MAG: pitrilysin family protein [Myxococcaceae bacterium]